jgi:hypothetical protein
MKIVIIPFALKYYENQWGKSMDTNNGDNQYLLRMQWYYSIPMGTSNTCIIVSL